ncbi:hypothetical protein BBO99_00006145 [Phytophthora kernoviae]|uniref:Translation initiation factor 3 N-terminal domain-containing protein n=2 Tax=Phytophthora kernoviae TaxID=325452 RepID=A0A3R7J603_9STRA|nr:hypothetical protein G195_006962 [Phytophthora kernoviae 00238/432]KAG2522073.1 hypothetical protein JM16_005997 [Phytophthora kernoviae]KAG2523709.1 hypothetical protein JM18_005680 [Phytophthora kernoviae]RLN02705.1 hypothetical protein BBI17_006271 [Phytophthora kernoviae]RLN78185.1 hypothetical protein BBO99_00006145 [Phytophthora kernoviae]
MSGVLLSLARPVARAALRPRRTLAGPQWFAAGARCFASADSKWGVTNDLIKARVVNIVDDAGNMRTDIPLREALQEAQGQGVDLVQVSPNGKRPTVCRLFDAKKRIYDLKKASKKVAKQQKVKSDKEVLVGVKIAPNDLRMKVEQLKRFLIKGHKVKVTVKFGQAFHLKDRALDQLKSIEDLVDAETGAASGQPRGQFGGVYVYYSPV